MGNRCARRWVTPKWHAGSPTGGRQDAVAGGYPDVVARGVCAAREAGRKQSARAVPAFRIQSEDRLQVAGAPCAGGGRAVLKTARGGRIAARPAPPKKRYANEEGRPHLALALLVPPSPRSVTERGSGRGGGRDKGGQSHNCAGRLYCGLGRSLPVGTWPSTSTTRGSSGSISSKRRFCSSRRVCRYIRSNASAAARRFQKPNVPMSSSPRGTIEKTYNCLYSSLNSVISSRIPVSASAATPSTDTLVAIALTPKSSRSTRCANRLIMSTFLSAASSSIPWRISATRRTRLSIE